MNRGTYCVCQQYAVGPRTMVVGAAHHSRAKCVVYGYDRDGKKSIVRYVSVGEGLEIPATEVLQ